MDIREASEGQDATRIGPYRIVRRLGQGGMGAVYEAVHELIGRKVAIKVLHPQYAADAELTERFFNEARAVNLVDHPGLVQVSDYGRLADGTSYIVMEFLKGETMGQRLRRLGTALPASDVVRLAWQIADSLLAAHEQGVVHRDLKPDNIMLVPDRHMPGGERTKLLDFGIAKLGDGWVGRDGHTVTGTVLGTPAYMAPEQCAGSTKIDAKADVYSLGCVLYHMLAGRPPFVGEGPGAVLGMQQFVEPEPLAKLAPATPLDLASLTHALLVKSRDGRPTMQAVSERLVALGHKQPTESRSTDRETLLLPASKKRPTGERQGARCLAQSASSRSTPSVGASQMMPWDRAEYLRRPSWKLLVGATAFLCIVASWGIQKQTQGHARRRSPEPARTPQIPIPSEASQKPASPLPTQAVARLAGSDAVPIPVSAASGELAQARVDKPDESVVLPRHSGTLVPANAGAKPAAPLVTAADRGIEAAEQLLRAQNYREALRAASASYVRKAHSKRSDRVVGLSACHLHDRPQAQAAHDALKGAWRTAIARACSRAGIPLSNPNLVDPWGSATLYTKPAVPGGLRNPFGF